MGLHKNQFHDRRCPKNMLLPKNNPKNPLKCGETELQFFFNLVFNCFLRGCIDKRISLWHILLINMTWGIKLHGQKGSQCCSWGITTRKMAKTRVTIEFWFFWIFCILTIKFIEIYIWKHIGDRSVSQLIGIELFKDS